MNADLKHKLMLIYNFYFYRIIHWRTRQEIRGHSARYTKRITLFSSY